MRVPELHAVSPYSPQTWMAIYDGHGGDQASNYLWQYLHLNLAKSLDRVAPRLKDASARGADTAAIDDIVIGAMNESFVQ